MCEQMARPKKDVTLDAQIPCVRLRKDVLKEAKFHAHVFLIPLAEFIREAVIQYNLVCRSKPLTAHQIALHGALDQAVKEDERLKLKQKETADAHNQGESQINREKPLSCGSEEEVGEEGEEIT